MRGRGDWWEEQFSPATSTGNSFHIYFRTEEEANLSALQAKVDLAFSKLKPDVDNFPNPVQRLTDVHFNSNNQFELSPGGNGDYMKIFIFILVGFGLVTVVNSNNINSSQFLNRIKEIGVRKLLGCDKYNLAKLFLLDSVIKMLVCTMFSFLLSYMVLLNVNLSIFSIGTSNLTNPTILLRIILGAVILGLLAGIYPVAKVSVIVIVNALKGKFLQSREWIISIRSSVIIIQIFAAAIMFSLTLVVLRQFSYLNNKPLGYDRNNLIRLNRPDNFSQHSWKSFQEKLKNETVFSSATTSSTALFQSLNTAYFRGEGRNFAAHWFNVDAGFIETMQIKMLAGRNFTEESSIVHEVVINERARQEFGRNENPVGTTLDTWFGEFRIVGIISDFHFKGFNSKITPLVLVLNEDYNWALFARYAPGKHKEALEAAQKIWATFQTDDALGYEFFDDTFNRMLERERQTKIIVILFTIISLIVTAIGLTGLIGYMASQSRQEIAIRKVLGSTVWQILMIFGKRFTILMSVGLIFSIPVILWLSETWLSSFEFKIASNVGDIAYPVLAVILLTFGVISRQAIAAAITNPVHVLRNE
jgi:putative ABC transport system permease protein